MQAKDLIVLGSSRLLGKLYCGDVDIGGSASISTISSALSLSDTTDSSSTTTGALKVSGGVGIAKKLYVGGNTYHSGATYFGSTYNISSSGQATLSQVKVGTGSGDTTITNNSATIANINSSTITNSGNISNKNGIIETDEIQSNVWNIVSTQNLGGDFFVAPTIMVTEGSTFYINSISNGVIAGYIVDSTNITSDSFAGHSWTSGSKIKLTGKITKDSNSYILGTCDGTLTANMNSSSGRITFSVTCKSATLPTATGSYTISDGTVMMYSVGGTNKVGIYMTSYGIDHSDYNANNANKRNKYSYIDIFNGSDGANPKVRIGKLDGLPAINSISPTGYGIYTTNGYFEGLIVANGGKIAGWTIGDEYITTNSERTTYDSTAKTGMTMTASGIGAYASASAKFTLSTAGVLTATGATITGVINADTGRIGGSSGWTIASQQISSGTLGSDNSMYLATKNLDSNTSIAGREGSDWRFTVGSKFGVTKTGALYANSANIIGALTATSLTINSGASISGDGASQILNSDIEIGGRNLLLGTYNSLFAASYSDYTLTSAIANVAATDNLILSFWAKGSVAMWCDFYFVKNTISYANASYFYPAFQITTDWQFFRYSGAASSVAATATAMRVRENASEHATYSNRGTLYIKELKLEKGNKATEWSPAPEEVDSDISYASSVATSYITYVSANDGIKVHNSGDETDYVQVNSTAIKMYRNNVEKMLLNDTSFRIGGVGTNIRNVYITDSAVQIRNNTSVLAEYGSAIKLYKPGTTTEVVTIDNNGGSFTGGITATSGTIGSGNTKWNIGSGMIYSGSNVPGTDSSTLVISTGTTSNKSIGGSTSGVGYTWMIAAGTGFGVTNTGDMYSKSGLIGGWTISDTSLSNGSWGESSSAMLCAKGISTAKSIGGSPSTVSGWVLTAGNGFGVTKAGVLYANSANITGSITATSLTINSGATISGDGANQILNSEIAIGGRNLLLNTTVSTSNISKIRANTSYTSVVTEDGIICYKITGSSTEHLFNRINAWDCMAEKLKANTTYTYSAWIKSSKGGTLSHTFLGHYNVSNSASTASDKTHEDTNRIYYPETIVANTWTKISVTFTTNSLVGSSFGVYPVYNTGSDTILYIYGFMLEEGNIASNWTPAPEDVDDKIDSIEVGGKNILRGTDTLTVTSGGWTGGAFYKSGSGGTLENVTLPSTPIPSITKGLKVTITTANSNIGFAQRPVPIRKQEITQSVWIKGTAGDIVILQPVYSSTSGSEESGQKIITIADSNWNKYTFTKTVNYDHLSTGIAAGYIYVKSATTGRVLYICADKLEYGNKATDWSPANEDVAADISDAAKTATNCITEISDAGIWVTPSGKKPTNTSTGAGATGTKIDANGVGIYKDGAKLAEYGTSTKWYSPDGQYLAAKVENHSTYGSLMVINHLVVSSSGNPSVNDMWIGSSGISTTRSYEDGSTWAECIMGINGGEIHMDSHKSDATGLIGAISIKPGRILATSYENSPVEANIRAASTAGSIYMYSQSTSSGNRGIYAIDSSNAYKAVIDITSNNLCYFRGAADSVSDLKKKDVITDYDWKIDDFINGLKPIAYRFKHDDGSLGDRIRMGFGAQDVRELTRSLYDEELSLYRARIIDETKEGTEREQPYHGEDIDDSKLSWTLTYEELIAPMVLEIQRLMARVDKLESDLKKYQNGSKFL